MIGFFTVKRIKIIVSAAGAGFALMLFVFFGPPKLFEYTSTPEFCGSCHVMDDQYEAWLKTGPHGGIKCVDCHLPNHNPVSHFVWKGIDGMKDVVYFYGRLYGDEIKAGSRAKRVINENCASCHYDMVSRIETEDSNCWSCHRRMDHNVREFGYFK